MRKKEEISMDTLSALSIFIGLLVVLIISNVALSESSPQIPPPVYGIEIIEYNDSIMQTAGTTKTYAAKVKNTGVMDLEKVRLGIDRLDKEWFYSNETINLNSGESRILSYSLKIPEDAEGLHAFSLVVYGTYGISTISNAKLVGLNIIKPSLTNEPHTQTTISNTSTSISNMSTPRETQKNTATPAQETNKADIVMITAVIFGCTLLILFVVRKFFV